MMPDDSESSSEESRDKSSLQGPHNRFILGYFGSPEEAIGLLESQLPESLKRVLHLDRLEVENSHFVDEQMSEVESDLLFRIPRADRKERDVYVYVLWEHQRRRDSWMALRMWIYVGMIYRHLLREGRLLPGRKLPFVYPVVLFQGTEGWRKGLVLEDLIDLKGLDSELHRWVPRFEIDLIRLDEDSPRITPDDPLARLGLSLMKAVMFHSVKEWLEENIEELNHAYACHRAPVLLILSYALMSRAGLTKEEFLSIVTSKGEGKMQYEAGSVADQLVKEGIEKGLEKGLEKGEAKKQAEIAVKLIEMGLSDEKVSEATGLPLNCVADLRSEMGKSQD